jgi:hypothetical protein
MQLVRSSRPGESGSAILIVFLFAAVLAISLYVEMPSVAFEAKRAKEQLLLDRGNEYAHAVKLYYRKFRRYPGSLDALENTNRLRFLRHRFKDPMTGEDKWRLLHAGPGGQLTDSKVNPVGLNANGSNTNASNTNGSNSNVPSNNGFGVNSGNNNQPGTTLTATAATPDAQTGAVVAPGGIPQRPPEMPVNAAQPAATAADGSQPAQPGTDPTQQPGAAQPVQPGPAPLGARGAMGLRPGAGAPTQLAAQFANAGDPNNPMQGVQGLMNNPNPAAPQGAPATPTPSPATSANTAATQNTSGTGALNSGGIAGVASLAAGMSIKVLNDQDDYSLWEFYYDPTKDTSAVAGGSGVNPMNGAPQPFGTNNLNGNTNSNSNNSTTPAPAQNTALNPNAVPAQPQ